MLFVVVRCCYLIFAVSLEVFSASARANGASQMSAAAVSTNRILLPLLQPMQRHRIDRLEPELGYQLPQQVAIEL